MPVQPDLNRASWQEPGPIDSVRARIVARIEALGGRVESGTAPEVRARFGSRIRYRFWGSSFAKGRAALPIAMRVTFEEHANSVAVEVQIRKDPGPLILSLPRSQDVYEARFTHIMSQLRA